MRKKALICVDDEKVVLDCLKAQIKQHLGGQYLCEVAENAREACEVLKDLIAQDTEVMMIISDWLMPEIKGDEFLIAVHQKYPDIVTVMITGQADDAAIARARKEANLYHCLHKPWNEADLLAAIRHACP